mmetsp:Transcript_11980/g.33770  ORF Transcript_11980/g.33770 Transcript_11980/m.33770 type:complete len:201 (-) Transcript_11980:891-1493(-)
MDGTVPAVRGDVEFAMPVGIHCDSNESEHGADAPERRFRARRADVWENHHFRGVCASEAENDPTLDHWWNRGRGEVRGTQHPFQVRQRYAGAVRAELGKPREGGGPGAQGSHDVLQPRPQGPVLSYDGPGRLSGTPSGGNDTAAGGEGHPRVRLMQRGADGGEVAQRVRQGDAVLRGAAQPAAPQVRGAQAERQEAVDGG